MSQRPTRLLSRKFKNLAIVTLQSCVKRRPLARSHSGGIAVLVRNHLASCATMCDWTNPSCLALRISGSILNYERDLYVLTVYIPPEGSSYLKANAIQFCDDRSLTILNGCAPGDTQGYFTYERGTCRSVIDYGIVLQSIWPCVRNFQVGVHNSILSDHSIILLELRAHPDRPYTHTSVSALSPLLRFDWNPESVARLKAQLSDPHTQLKIQIMEAKLKLEHTDLDALVAEFSDLLLEETKKVVKFRKRGPPSRKQKEAKKWYDQSLRTLKEEIYQLNANLCTQSFHSP